MIFDRFLKMIADPAYYHHKISKYVSGLRSFLKVIGFSIRIPVYSDIKNPVAGKFRLPGLQ